MLRKYSVEVRNGIEFPRFHNPAVDETAVLGEERQKNAENNDPRQEVRHVGQRLYNRLQPANAAFVQQYGQHDRRQRPHNSL